MRGGVVSAKEMMSALLLLILLQRPHVHLTPLQRLDRSQHRICTTESGHDGDAVMHGGDVDIDFILTRTLARDSVDDKHHVLVLYQIE